MTGQQLHIKLAYPATWDKKKLSCREVTFLAEGVTHSIEEIMDAFDSTTVLLLKKPGEKKIKSCRDIIIRNLSTNLNAISTPKNGRSRRR